MYDMWFNADWPMTSYFYLVKAKAIDYRHYIVTYRQISGFTYRGKYA